MSERMQSKLHIEGSAASRSLEEQQRLMEEYDTAIYENGSDDAAFEEAMQKREHENNVAIEERIMSNPTTRRMYMMAQQIAELKAGGADTTDKEDKLQELLVTYSDEAHSARKNQLSSAEQERSTPKGDRIRLEKQIAAEEALAERSEEIDFILAATEGTASIEDSSQASAEVDEVSNPEEENDSVEENEQDVAEDAEAESGKENEFAIGDVVKVRRTSGEMEDDWEVIGYNDELGRVMVGHRKKGIRKSVPLDELRSYQQVDSAEEPQSLDESPVVSASDLEMLDENRPTAARSRMRRIKDAFTPVGAAAEVSAWAATREKLSRKNRIAAVLGGAALAGALIWAKAKGLDFDNPFNNGDVPTPRGGSGAEALPTPSGTPTTEADPTPDLIETVRVNPGDGEIKVTQSLLESNGIYVSAAEAQRIGEHAQLNDILRGDNSYNFSGSSMDRIGKTGEFEARSGVVAKLLKSADELGYR